MKSIYFDLVNSGISGDMLLASFLGLLPDPTNILSNLKDLKNILKGVSKIEVDLTKIKRMGIETNKLELTIEESKTHRTPEDLSNALENYLSEKDFSKQAKEFARSVLNTLFKAEAEVHGNLIENIHLHELSSVDTLIDILGVTNVIDTIGGFDMDFSYYCSEVPLGGGKIKSAHGILPIPAPATVKILEKSNLLVKGGPIETELVTPTGAALLVNLHPTYKEFLPSMNLIKMSFGTGQKEFGAFSNILRLFYGEITNLTHSLSDHVEEVMILETAVDDVSGELLGNFINIIGNEDILDIQIVPSITKKNRPGHIIKIICNPSQSYDIILKTLKELGTLGVRFYANKRVCIHRKIVKKKIEINNKWYDLDFKISFIKRGENMEIINVKPEFEDLSSISKETSLPVREIQFYCQNVIEMIYNNKM
ncbi:MAG: nickel pincer cofactor biosynthesis protein LarC [Candidatus Lokiarchaeota archaeon]|nr:nickel pincer cofactor biosynthesis protein LarC [Candidatus Lokiarchaeota archaeon]